MTDKDQMAITIRAHDFVPPHRVEQDPLSAEEFPQIGPEQDDGVDFGFPGCRPIRILRNEIGDFEGRFEYWDAQTETAWVVREPTSAYHELPGQRLARLTEYIAATRGSSIESLGTADLLVRDDQGERHEMLQADQILYLRSNAALKIGSAVEVGHDDLPDVILEVDLTTDVRRRKLGLYQSWGFPELWVEVPDRHAPSRPNRKPGLTIRVLESDGYHEVSKSRAFQGWTAAEIHAAMNEEALSAETASVLRRVGRTLRRDSGTGPDHNPFLRQERDESRREGHREGHREGQREGHRKMVLVALAARKIRTSSKFEHRLGLIDASAETLMRAALACSDEDDFLRWIEASPGTR